MSDDAEDTREDAGSEDAGQDTGHNRCDCDYRLLIETDRRKWVKTCQSILAEVSSHACGRWDPDLVSRSDEVDPRIRLALGRVYIAASERLVRLLGSDITDLEQTEA